jgi:tripeptide aminopeptidase
MTARDNTRIAELASMRAVHKAFGWMHLQEQRIRRWQMEVVAIPAPPFGEAERARWFATKFAELGLENVHLDEEGNALGELRGEANVPVVMLSAHMDTVFPAGTDVTPREEEFRIVAPGASDNGAGLAGLLAMAAAMKHAGMKPACTVIFAANVGEEGEGDLRGMRYLFAEGSEYAQRIRAVIALEGVGEATVVDRALGSRRLRVTVEGPGGHSWADAGRPNAIVALSAAIAAVGRIPLPKNPRTTLNVGVIAGGTSVNSIPSSAYADIDVRSTTAHQLDRMELTVLRTMEAAVTAPELRLSAERIGNRLPGQLAETTQLYRSVKAIDRHLKINTQWRIGSTDANLPLSLGVPALAMGAGGTGGGMHTLEEWHDPRGRDLALRRILLLLLDTCRCVADEDA